MVFIAVVYDCEHQSADVRQLLTYLRREHFHGSCMHRVEIAENLSRLIEILTLNLGPFFLCDLDTRE